MRMEVRCCCKPQKLLGTVEVPDDTKARDHLPFILKKPAEQPWLPPDVPTEMVNLQCLYYCPPLETAYLAVKSEDFGLDVLRRIPSFQEHVPEVDILL